MGGVAKGIGNVAGNIGGGVGKTLGLYGGGGLLGKGQSPDQAAKLEGLLNDETGKPKYAGYTSMLDKETGLLPDQYKLLAGMDTDAAAKKLQQEALSSDPTSWAKYQLESQAADQARGLDTLAKQSAGNVAGAQSRLAMRGGLSSGAAERISGGGARDLLAGQQAVQGQGAQQKLGILAQDASTKQALLNQAANMGIDASKYNLGNTFQQKQNEEAAKLQDYQEQMKAYAAKKAGLATILGGGGKKG